MNRILVYLVLTGFTMVPLCADYLISEPVGHNIIHHHEYRSAGPWHLHVLEIDLSSSWNHLETIKAENRLQGSERTSAMAASVDAEAHRVVAAINGDFYAAGGVPINAQVVNGTLLKRAYPRTVFGTGPVNEPLLEIVSFSGQVLNQDLAVHAINGINEDRQENFLVVYNRYKGARTGTNQWGTEITTTILDSIRYVNTPFRVVVTEKDSAMEAGSGNTYIGQNEYILSAHGSAKAAVDSNIFLGDTLELQLDFAQVPHPIWQLIGGTPRLIRDGTQSVEWQAESVGHSFTYDRHPRTAVGINADSSKAYFVTVDGRQPGYSVGMSLFELANYMLEWEMYQAVNLDGGGSTTMVVRGSVVNRPSDASGERYVANALLAISTAPTGPLAVLEIEPSELYALVGSQTGFGVSGFDSTYNPVEVPADSLVWSCDSLIGSIDTNGVFTAGETETDGFVVVQLGAIIDSALVHVTDVSTITLTPDPLILAVGESQQINATARDAFGNVIQIDPVDYEWAVTPQLGPITTTGYFTAEEAGIAQISASYSEISGIITATIGDAITAIVDDFSTLTNWSLTGVVVNLSACHLSLDSSLYVSAPSSARLDYSLAQGGVSALYMNSEILISGSPEAVSIQVYGDGSTHWLRGEFRDQSDDKFLVNFTESSPGINWDNSWQALLVNLDEAIPHWGNPGALLDFPITWTKIYLAETDEDKKDSGSILIDDLSFHFIGTGIEGTGLRTPSHFELEGPFPNPFNNSTRFRFSNLSSGILDLKVHDIAGRQVDVQTLNVADGHLDFTWRSPTLGSGLYIYNFNLNGQRASGKLMILR